MERKWTFSITLHQGCCYSKYLGVSLLLLREEGLQLLISGVCRHLYSKNITHNNNLRQLFAALAQSVHQCQMWLLNCQQALN